MQAIIVVLSTLGVTFLMRYLTASSTKKPVKYKIGKTEYFILKYNKIYSTVGIASVILSGILAILAYTGIMLTRTKGETIAAISVVLLFLILGIPLILVYRNIKIEVSKEKIRYWNLFGNIKEISWNEIKKVECINKGKTLKLVTDKKCISVDTQMVGFLTFNMVMRDKLDRSIYIDAVKNMNLL